MCIHHQYLKMKKKIFCLSIVLFSFVTISIAQVKKKPKEKAPTQSEIEKLMKEAEAGMDQIDAATKNIIDSMDIKMPSLKNVPKVSDKQLAEAWDVEERIVPKKDVARIASITKINLNEATLENYVNAINTKTNLILNAASKILAEKIYSDLKVSGKSSDAIGNTAAGLWMMGRLQPALYIMGRICIEDVTNTDNLSNYAAMLSMCGLQQFAIPCLNYLNLKFPGNSTLFNNLGQAWFGLGDIIKSEKYLDSAIRIYAWHPQANFTKSFIVENRGNKSEAINLVKKSILHAYTADKEGRLEQLGYKLTFRDVSLPRNPKSDGLNLGAFNTPPFPKSVDECLEFDKEWTSFRQQLQLQISALSAQLEDAQTIVNEKREKRMNESVTIVKASLATGKPVEDVFLFPLHFEAASLKQNEVKDEYERKLDKLLKNIAAFLYGPGASLKMQYDKDIEKLQEENLEQTGEGLPNKDFCPKFKEVTDKYLSANNSETEFFFKEGLEILKIYLNESAHWQIYSAFPEEFTAHKLEAKITWLSALNAKSPIDFISITEYKCNTPVKSKAGKLAEFDDVACKYHSEISFPIGKMKMDCSRWTTELDLSFVKFGLKQNMDKETFADQFMECNIEVGAKIGKDLKLGPLSVEASAGSRVGIEIDRSGIKDIYITGGVKVEAGTNIIGEASVASGTPASMMGVGVSDHSIDAGVEGKISIISGRGSIYGTGIFSK